jgi:hypothetical protein
MRAILAATMITLLATAAFAQDHVPRYGEADAEKSQTDIQAEKDAQRAYRKSLGNIPDKGPTDPWGTMRPADAPKTTTSTSAAKSAKTKTPKTGAAN